MSKTLTVLLSQSDADRFGFPHAGHSSVPLEGAREQFDALIKAGYVAFETPADQPVGADVTLGRKLKTFDPDAESIFMFPFIRGG